MKKYLDWTLKNIRKSDNFSWMEERRLEWVPLAISRLQTILEGKTFIVLTDPQREWFSSYMLSSINSHVNKRPFLPFVDLKTFFPNLGSLKNAEDIDLLEDLLNISFPNGYVFFYVGQSNNFNFQIAKKRDDSFMWILDEYIQNSFFLSLKDKDLDLKLIQLYKLLDKTIDVLLFPEELEKQ
ncbi:MAG: hypothetical protein CR967_00460 [Proteobacteria bacterium]|nr:MAG: hypothetical protein CR967_00460 [Pseudomonadota bacterium]